MTTELEKAGKKEIAKLAVALVAAQKELKPAIKNEKNPFFKKNYADLSSVWDAVRKPLTDNGLSVVQLPGKSGDDITLTTMLLHTSGESISGTASARPTKQDPQGVGSCLTYLRRYGLSAMIGVVCDEDDDGNAASKPTQPQRPAPQKPTPQKPKGKPTGPMVQNGPPAVTFEKEDPVWINEWNGTTYLHAKVGTRLPKEFLESLEFKAAKTEGNMFCVYFDDIASEIKAKLEFEANNNEPPFNPLIDEEPPQ